MINKTRAKPASGINKTRAEAASGTRTKLLATRVHLLVLPAMLQSVEIAKGPGTMPVEVNYAIGGTVNYRTLEPTRARVLAFDVGADRYGGVSPKCS